MFHIPTEDGPDRGRRGKKVVRFGPPEDEAVVGSRRTDTIILLAIALSAIIQVPITGGVASFLAVMVISLVYALSVVALRTFIMPARVAATRSVASAPSKDNEADELDEEDPPEVVQGRLVQGFNWKPGLEEGRPTRPLVDVSTKG